MSNIFSQPGLGQLLQGQQEFYSRQQKEKLNRDMLRAQAEQFRAKAQQYSDPRYLQAQMPAGVREFEYYQGLDPEAQKRYLGVKRATPEEALMRKGVTIDPNTGRATPLGGFGQALGNIQAQQIQAQTPAEVAKVAATKTAGMAAESKQKALLELPTTVAQANEMLSVLDEIERHPGLSAVVGAPEPLKGRVFGFDVPGSPAADFSTLYDRLEGQKFKQAFETLKGGGQITEIESKKATQAASTMSTAQSEDEFIRGLNQYKSVIRGAVGRAKLKAGFKPDSNITTQQPAQSSEVIDYTEYFR